MIIIGILPTAVTFLGGRKLSDSVEQLLLKVENAEPALVEKIAYGSALGFYGLSFAFLLVFTCIGFVLEERKGYARIIGKLETKAEQGGGINSVRSRSLHDTP